MGCKSTPTLGHTGLGLGFKVTVGKLGVSRTRSKVVEFWMYTVGSRVEGLDYSHVRTSSKSLSGASGALG